jgi:hypothetical protein
MLSKLLIVYWVRSKISNLVIVFSEKFPPKAEEGTIPLCKVPPLTCKKRHSALRFRIQFALSFSSIKSTRHSPATVHNSLKSKVTLCTMWSICRWHSFKNNLHISRHETTYITSFFEVCNTQWSLNKFKKTIQLISGSALFIIFFSECGGCNVYIRVQFHMLCIFLLVLSSLVLFKMLMSLRFTQWGLHWSMVLRAIGLQLFDVHSFVGDCNSIYPLFDA